MDGVLAGDPAGIRAAARVTALPRNGASARIACAHMLCREPATAFLLFDPRVATAWLVDAEGTVPRGLPMCTAHADRFRPPVGWAISDQRSPGDSRAHVGAAGSNGPEAASSDPDAAGTPDSDDALAVTEPIPTPLLSRAFRTTSQVLT